MNASDHWIDDAVSASEAVANQVSLASAPNDNLCRSLFVNDHSS